MLSHLSLKYFVFWPGNMALSAKGLDIKTDNLNSLPRTHMFKSELMLLANYALTSTLTPWHMGGCVCTHTPYTYTFHGLQNSSRCFCGFCCWRNKMNLITHHHL